MNAVPSPESSRLSLLPASFAQLPAIFHERVEPTKVTAPRLIRLNEALAEELQWPPPGLAPDILANLFAGNLVPQPEPIAMAYAGHQFGGFVPQLGDGRAILLGEAEARDGRRYDIQLKGAGRTRYSRRGDGRAALGPVLREYLVSEAMHALGIPTTRTLAAVTTGETVLRDRPLPGAVLTRVAASHVRVGTFEFAAAQGDGAPLRLLVDHVLERLYPEAREAEAPALAMLELIVGRQARLVASWLQVGFIHGVMNTDNMAISGETLDYGPCAFMDTYDPATVFSSIDHGGRYAYANQPPIAQWNLARLAETLLPLLDPDPERAVTRAEDALGRFADQLRDHWILGMRRKLGFTSPHADDLPLIESFLDLLYRQKVDYTLAFRRLGEGLVRADDPARTLFGEPEAFDAWRLRWSRRLESEPLPARDRAEAMRLANPLFIPRNHRVEQALAAAVERADFAPFTELLGVVGRPFDGQPGLERYADPPGPQEQVMQTFCGT